MPRSEGVESSLFPFMSVLACTIGSLTLMITAMALSSVGATRLASEEEERRRERLEAELPELERALSNPELDEEELAAVEDGWSTLETLLATRGIDSDQPLAEIAAELERDKKIAQLLAERSRGRRLERTAGKKQGELEASIAVLQSRRETLPILIDPTGLSRHLKPYFVECDEEGLTAYRATDDFRYFVPRPALSSSGDFGRYLRRVRALPGSLLVLLVRPSGIGTYQDAERVARAAGVRVAKMPLPGNGPLDWSLLRKAEGAG